MRNLTIVGNLTHISGKFNFLSRPDDEVAGHKSAPLTQVTMCSFKFNRSCRSHSALLTVGAYTHITIFPIQKQQDEHRYVLQASNRMLSGIQVTPEPATSLSQPNLSSVVAVRVKIDRGQKKDNMNLGQSDTVL